jgi:beta-phosphoglucomutase
LTHERCIDTLIFDFDGVIADTEPLYWSAWAEILDRRGIRFTWDQYCEIGLGIQDTQMIFKLRQFVEDSSMLSGLEEQIALRDELVRDKCISAPPIQRETIEMLHSLGSYRLGLVTSSTKVNVEPALRAAGVFDCFEAIVFGEDVENHKPAPAPYLLLGNRLNVKTGLVFEDSTAGIISAQQAGFVVVPVADPKHLPQLVYREIRFCQAECKSNTSDLGSDT